MDEENKDVIKSTKKKENKEVVKLHEELNLANDKYLRLAAELQNIKRRNETDLANYLKYEGEEIIIKLLPIIDNFERAIKMDDSNLTDEVSKFLEGFKMIYAKMANIFNELDIKEIDCLGKEFNPNYMEAMLTDKDENMPSNTVLDVLQKGYIYKDKIIRPAMVKVNE